MTLCASENCTGCGACASVCPKKCIRMEADREGFLRPVIDTYHCAQCGACKNACPVLHPVANSVNSDAYAAMNNDRAIRQESTSGGIFTLLCQWVFEHGGIAFGAAFEDNFSVSHCMAHSLEELRKFRGAKYSQSIIGNSYIETKELLDAGNYVLFSGTPCQIAGLKSFLQKEYDKLILVDLVCHGVPSPYVWAHYIHYRSQVDADGAAPTSICLRSKETGWPSYSVRFDYENKKKYSALNSSDPFIQCFVNNLCLRPSCYRCIYKGILRCSDFTLGDYWGVWTQLPEYNDGTGTSIVLLHTPKSHQIWKDLSAQIKTVAVSPNHCMDENPSALYAPSLPLIRSNFMTQYKTHDFLELVQELVPSTSAPPFDVNSLLIKIKNRIKSLISGI